MLNQVDLVRKLQKSLQVKRLGWLVYFKRSSIKQLRKEQEDLMNCDVRIGLFFQYLIKIQELQLMLTLILRKFTTMISISQKNILKNNAAQMRMIKKEIEKFDIL
ncbi:hypothetical protein ABPG72_013829 [Tetrahymena utriculariae]